MLHLRKILLFKMNVNIRNKLTNILRICEETYYSNKLDNVKADNKETWRVLNEILNRKKHTVYSINLRTMMMANIYMKFQRTLPMDLVSILQMLVLHSQAKYLKEKEIFMIICKQRSKIQYF